MSKKEETINENNPAQVEVPTEPVIDAVTEPVPAFTSREAIAAMVNGDLNAFSNMIKDTLQKKATIAVDEKEMEVRNDMFNASPEVEVDPEENEADENQPELDLTPEKENEE